MLFFFLLNFVFKSAFLYIFFKKFYVFSFFLYFFYIYFNFFFFWFFFFMYFICLFIIFLLLKKNFNYIKFKLLFFFYIVLFFIIVFLFVLEDLLLFIFFFEAILFFLLFLNLNFIFNNRFILGLFYLIFFSALSGIFCFFIFSIVFLNWNFLNFFFVKYYSTHIQNSLLLNIWFFSFCIFSIKIPIFPFFFWLLNLHVEVSSENSVFLASIILKSGFVGILKFNLLLFSVISLFYSNFLSLFVLNGLYYLLFVLLLSLDYKKILGIWSVLHINVTLLLMWFDNSLFILLFVFSNLSHILSSGSFFIFLGFYYEKYNNKNILFLSSFFGANILQFFFIFLILNNLDFPFFLMFYLELFTFLTFSFLSFYLFLFLCVVNFFLFISSLLFYFVINFYLVKWDNVFLRLDLTINDILLICYLLIYIFCLYWEIHIIF